MYFQTPIGTSGPQEILPLRDRGILEFKEPSCAFKYELFNQLNSKTSTHLDLGKTCFIDPKPTLLAFD